MMYDVWGMGYGVWGMGYGLWGVGYGIWGMGLLIQEQLLRRNVKRFQGGLVFKTHRLLYHSTLGSRVITKKRRRHRFTTFGLANALKVVKWCL